MTIIVLLLAATALAGILLGLRLWLRSDLDRRLAAAEGEFGALSAPGRPALAPGAGETAVVQLRYVRWLLEPGRDDGWFRPWKLSRRQMGQTEEALAALRSHPSADPYARVAGAVLRGYRSPVDSDLTSYSLRAPEDYGPAAMPLPLVVRLHGHMGVRPFQGHPAPDLGEDVLVLSPHGKGAIDYMGPAEADVLAAIDDACGRYRVSGVYLTGGSMGGTGCWQLAAHYPWRFTAVAPVAANADPRVWWRLWDARPPEEPPAGSLAEALKKLRLLDSPVTYAANLRDVPALVHHGDRDEIVPVEHARSMVAALEAAGCPVEYREVSGGEHKLAGNADFKAIVRWLVAHPPKEGGCRPPPAGVAERFAAERLLPGAAPTFSDLFNARFAVVYGTGSADERTNAMLKRQAEDFARDWEWRYASRPPVFADAEFPAAEGGERCRDAGLLLYGGPDENSVTRRLLALARPAPPVRFEPGRCVLETPAGPIAAEGPTAGARFCWQNPLAPGRMIGVVWGASWRGLVDSNARFGAIFDWTVHQHRHWFGFGLFDDKTAGPDSFLAVGFWSRDWKLDAKFLWKRDPAAAPAPGRAPRYWSADEAPAGRALALDELAPVEIEQAGGPIGFGRGWSGGELSAGSPARRLAGGLGVRGRSRVAYDLGGRWSRFTATAGADLAGRTPESLTAPRIKHGRMVFIVRGDGKELARSGDLGLADAAEELSVDVRGVSRLELLVVPAGRYEWHLGPGAWGDAKLVP